MKRKATCFWTVAALLLFCKISALAASVTWTGSGDGTSWSDPANWSGNAVPDSGSDVTIGVVAGNPTIQFSAAAGIAEINSLNTSEPMNLSGGTLQVATTFQTSQNITLAGGTIKGGTVSGTGAAGLTVGSSGTLDGVTLVADLTLQDGAYLTVRNGLTLNGAKLIFNNAGINYSSAHFEGTQTLGGTGEVVLGGTSSRNLLYAKGDYTPAGAAVLTIGSGITVHGSQGGTLLGSSQYDSITNLGTIDADTSGTTISLAGTWNMFGTVKTENGGVVALTGTYDNTGKTLNFGPGTGPLTLNGAIKGNIGATISTTSLILDGVTLSADLTLQDGARLTVRNGLTLNAAKLIFNNAGINYSSAYFEGTQTLGGTGEVVFGGTTSRNLLYATGDYTPAGAAVLTIGSGITVHGSQGGILSGSSQYDSITNQGTINADTSDITISLSGAAITNEGAVVAQNNGTLSVSGPVSINSHGIFNSSPTGGIRLQSNLLGSTTAIGVSNLQGTTIFNGSGTAASPQLLEALSLDVGNVLAGFSKNFGSMHFTNNPL